TAWRLPTPLRSTIARVDAGVASRWPTTTLTYSTIGDFKGMENRCVAVVDLDGPAAGAADIHELYVAMTRAHAGLWLAVPEGRRAALNRLIAEHTAQMLRQGASS